MINVGILSVVIKSRPLPPLLHFLSLLLRASQRRCSPLAATQSLTDSVGRTHCLSFLQKVKEPKKPKGKTGRDIGREGREEAAIIGTPLRRKAQASE